MCRCNDAKCGILTDLTLKDGELKKMLITDNSDSTGEHPVFIDVNEGDNNVNLQLTMQQTEDLISQLLCIVNQEKYRQTEEY